MIERRPSAGGMDSRPGATARRIVITAWLVCGGAGLGAPSGVFAQPAPPPVSDVVRAFIEKGMAGVLAGCSTPMPPKTCSHGRCLKTGPVRHFDDNNSGLPITFQAIEYQGMTKAYRAGAVVELTVSSPAWPVRHGLVVGVRFPQVLAVLGAPMVVQVGEVDAEQVALYRQNEDCVTFTIHRPSRRVRKIVWSFYYD